MEMTQAFPSEPVQFSLLLCLLTSCFCPLLMCLSASCVEGLESLLGSIPGPEMLPVEEYRADTPRGSQTDAQINLSTFFLR